MCVSVVTINITFINIDINELYEYNWCIMKDKRVLI